MPVPSVSQCMKVIPCVFMLYQPDTILKRHKMMDVGTRVCHTVHLFRDPVWVRGSK